MNVQARESAVVTEVLLDGSAQVELCLPQCIFIEVDGEAQSVSGQFHCCLNFMVLHGGGQCFDLPPQVPQPRQQALNLDDGKKKGLKGEIFWHQRGHVPNEGGEMWSTG